MKKIILNINGNIGIGKSTLCNYIQSKNENVYIVNEIVDDLYGMALLKLYYENPSEYAFSFDKYLLQRKLINIKDIFEITKEKEDEDCIIIFDRSVEFDVNVFSKFRLEKGYISMKQHENLKIVEKTILSTIKTLFFDYETVDIFISSNLELCLERIKNRARLGENILVQDMIVLDHLHNLCCSKDSIVFSSSASVEENYDLILKIIK